VGRFNPTQYQEVQKGKHGTLLRGHTDSGKLVLKIEWKNPPDGVAPFMYVGLGMKKAQAMDLGLRLIANGIGQ